MPRHCSSNYKMYNPNYPGNRISIINKISNIKWNYFVITVIKSTHYDVSATGRHSAIAETS